MILSEVQVDGDEQVHLEVDNFEGFDSATPHLGMASAGSEEIVLQKLTRAGSLSIDDPSVAKVPAGTLAAQEEEKKQWSDAFSKCIAKCQDTLCLVYFPAK